MTGLDVVRCARTWIGTPYVPQASLKGKGTDCIGLVLGVGLELGLLDGSGIPPYRESDVELLETELRKRLDPSPGCDMGDAIVFALHRRLHAGICAGDTLIHLHGSRNGVTEIPFEAKWRSRAVSGWRYRGLDG